MQRFKLSSARSHEQFPGFMKVSIPGNQEGLGVGVVPARGTTLTKSSPQTTQAAAPHVQGQTSMRAGWMFSSARWARSSSRGQLTGLRASKSALPHPA